MVKESTKEREAEAPAEGVEHPSDSPDSEGEKASEKTASHSQVNTDDEVKDDHRDGDNGQVSMDEKTSDKEPAKESQRGRKKADTSEPPVKKAKKERPSPVRKSVRVKNQEAGIILEKAEGLPEPKRSQRKKAVKNGEEQNGTAVEV